MGADLNTRWIRRYIGRWRDGTQVIAVVEAEPADSAGHDEPDGIDEVIFGATQATPIAKRPRVVL